MVKLNITNCNNFSNEEFISGLKSLIKSYEFDIEGEINLNLSDIKHS